MRRPFRFLLTVIAGCSLCMGCVSTLAYLMDDPTADMTYRAAGAQDDDDLPDDRSFGRKPDFDPARADREPRDRWVFNESASVFRLNITPPDPREEKDFLLLHPSYAAAVVAAKTKHPDETILPSVNMLDGKAKQFDDGLYAALDLVYYQGLRDRLKSHIELVRRIYDQVDKDGPAAPFLAAGLELAGVSIIVNDVDAKWSWFNAFEKDEIHSKPIGFYTWSEDLRACFRFLRFFQKEFDSNNLEIPYAILKAFHGDVALEVDYRDAVKFYAKLTNPAICYSMVDLHGDSEIGSVPRRLQFWADEPGMHHTVALFPPSKARETVLFEKLFPQGLPPNADLMKELIKAIRSGKVDLKPGKDSGWYDYQVYALETMLLPEKGAEHDKLLLSHTYKKRMVEAFEAMITKHRETHVRELSIPFGCSAHVGPLPPPQPDIKPHLRVEPCPSYYLRTARAYSFLSNFLEASVGKDALQKLHGLCQTGPREENLYAELQHMRELFYGLYLVSAEDIGLKSELLKGERGDSEQYYQIAASWLAKAFEDADLATDTRVVVPIYVDMAGGVTRLWATLGVRTARLRIEYARPPRIRPKEGGDWEQVGSDRLAPVEYLIAVDEFAEVELPGQHVLSREELRAVCDHEKTKDAILAALRKGR